MLFYCPLCNKRANLAHRCSLAGQLPVSPAATSTVRSVKTGEFTLRQAVPADLPVITALDVELFGVDAWDLDALVAGFVSKSHELLVLVHGKRVVGYGMVEHRKRFSHIVSIGVDSSLRGQGLGQWLLKRLIARARGRASSTVVLEVRSDNYAARSLYLKNGFIECGIRRNYYADGADGIKMRIELSENALDKAA